MMTFLTNIFGHLLTINWNIFFIPSSTFRFRRVSVWASISKRHFVRFVWGVTKTWREENFFHVTCSFLLFSLWRSVQSHLICVQIGDVTTRYWHNHLSKSNYNTNLHWKAGAFLFKNIFYCYLQSVIAIYPVKSFHLQEWLNIFDDFHYSFHLSCTHDRQKNLTFSLAFCHKFSFLILKLSKLPEIAKRLCQEILKVRQDVNFSR